MKLIHSNAELLIQKEGLEGVYKMIELAGRTCYKSEVNITADSASKFVDRMIKNNHTAMLEHGTIYLKIPYSFIHKLNSPELYKKYRHNPYTKVRGYYELMKGHYLAITTNLRVLVENGWLDDLKYMCEPTIFHKRRYTMRFITDVGVGRELIRHRLFSYAQESSRYCNYSKSRFNKELTFIIPSWLPNLDTFSYNEIPLKGTSEYNYYTLKCALNYAEKHYFTLLNNGCSPQEARQVLPNALKTEIIMTGFASDWKHFFDLRYYGKTGKPHPDMLELTTKAKEVLEKANAWDMIFPHKK